MNRTIWEAICILGFVSLVYAGFKEALHFHIFPALSYGFGALMFLMMGS